MSTPADAARAQFSPRTVLVLIVVGLVALAGFAVLGVYAPELRARSDPGAHALSSSAVGYRGMVILLRRLGAPVEISRSRPSARQLGPALLVLTPPLEANPREMTAMPRGRNDLVVLPKWVTQPDPLRPGFVRKQGSLNGAGALTLRGFEPKITVNFDKGVSRPVLQGVAAPFAARTVLPLGPIDRLQTISGDDWVPVLVDGDGRAVVAYARDKPWLVVLADPDLLNNQGVADIRTAAAGVAVLQGLRGDGPVIFDLTLNGIKDGQNLGRLMLEPPWLPATLCVLAAAILMGLHALARFGPTERTGRAIALGAAALVDNSAGLIRIARKEAALAPDYVEVSKALVAQAAGGGPGADGDRDPWLARLARRRGLASPEDLAGEAAQAKTRDDLLAVARKLYQWRREMTREGG